MELSILGIITAVLPMALRLIGMWLDKSGADAATHQKFLDFVEAASKNNTQSAALRSSYDAQKARLEAARAAMKQQAGGPDAIVPPNSPEGSPPR